MTRGETLFRLLRDRAIIAEEPQNSAWGPLREALAGVGGSDSFPEYIVGAVAVHAVRRLLRYWRRERPNVSAEHLWAKNVSHFIANDVFPGIEKALVWQIARAVILAEAASARDVSPAVKKRLLAVHKVPRCYLCETLLDVSASADARDALTLEHLWPSSLGGDSIDENLLPACRACQTAKDDAPSWEWLNVHNLVLPPSPSEEAMKSVTRSVRIARHYHRVMRICDSKQLSLKDAFLRAGPMPPNIAPTRVANRHPVTFFDL